MNGTSPMSSDWNLNFENMATKYYPAKFRDLIREINKELIGDEAVQMVIATSNSDWNVYDVTANKCKQCCQYHRLINDGTTIVLLDALADPQSNWFEIYFPIK
jgi:hypothetical protein